ncbi:MAG TPA: YkgJ family cysteine cluster protein [Peptococcaceae bacterium]|nr:YkgJ family cysteine cluster protein [Peptococcaceae bacterium]
MSDGWAEVTLFQKLLREELAKKRPSYPQEIDKPWLSRLLDIYQLLDAWVEVETHLKGIKNKIACFKGCGSCCRLLPVPINHLEYLGLSWYVTEMLVCEDRYAVKSRLQNLSEDSPCPFLIDNACLVYPLRPLACRQFFILNNPCLEGQNPWFKRREDIYCALNQEISWLIATRYFPVYGLKGEAEQRKAFNEGFLTAQDKPLTAYRWSAVSEKI